MCHYASGANLYGLLEQCGLGQFVPGVPDGSIKDVQAASARSNAHILGKVRPDRFEEELHKLTCADAELGRMSWPVEADSLDVSCLRLCPRFACVLARALRCAYGMRVKVWC